MNDLHISSGAYALNALDDQERAFCEAHLAGCAECRAEVASFLEAAAHLASTTELAPPSALRSRVLTGISQVRPLPPESSKHRADVVETEQPVIENVVPIRRQRWVPRLVAAAAVVAVLAGGATVWHPWIDNTNTGQQADSPIGRVLHASDAKTWTKHLAIGGEAKITRSVSQRGAVMTVKDLPTPPSGKSYELWLQKPDSTMVRAGMISNNQSSLLIGNAAKATGAAISVEPAAGSDSPTTPPVALFVFGPGQ